MPAAINEILDDLLDHRQAILPLPVDFEIFSLHTSGGIQSQNDVDPFSFRLGLFQNASRPGERRAEKG